MASTKVGRAGRIGAAMVDAKRRAGIIEGFDIRRYLGDSGGMVVGPEVIGLMLREVNGVVWVGRGVVAFELFEPFAGWERCFGGCCHGGIV